MNMLRAAVVRFLGYLRWHGYERLVATVSPPPPVTGWENEYRQHSLLPFSSIGGKVAQLIPVDVMGAAVGGLAEHVAPWALATADMVRAVARASREGEAAYEDARKHLFAAVDWGAWDPVIYNVRDMRAWASRRCIIYWALGMAPYSYSGNRKSDFRDAIFYGDVALAADCAVDRDPPHRAWFGAYLPHPRVPDRGWRPSRVCMTEARRVSRRLMLEPVVFAVAAHVLDQGAAARNPQPQLDLGRLFESERFTSYRNEIRDAAKRALAAGAEQPIDFVGMGAQGIVFCERKPGGLAYKVARWWDEGRERAEMMDSLRSEFEWLLAAKAHPESAPFVVEPVRVDYENGVLVRECARGERPSWNFDLEPYYDRTRSVPGWSPPEFGEKQWIMTSEGPKLVDAGFATRLGDTFARHVAGVLSGAIQSGESLNDLAWAVGIEAMDGRMDKGVALRLLAELRVRGASEELTSPSRVTGS